MFAEVALDCAPWCSKGQRQGHCVNSACAGCHFCAEYEALLHSAQACEPKKNADGSASHDSLIYECLDW